MPSILNMTAEPKAHSGHADAVRVVAAYADNTLSQNIASKTQSECGVARGSCGMMRYMRCGRVAPAAASRVEKCY